ncbi:alpha-amylase family protein [Conexibacter stalactiti]|uniref:Beta-galactosidase trimerization domain-containing protein n=1 Tax=Conexibacter stalactiti TaxID=1940611 RepID=A0ABU4HN11_9ACTN|nr:alpha-amylase family protein [Conexibacter stalactiti]MDW5594097.1 beta-galactosidase trimerization domain-containing protein [Conexibacter stalactiti]MEC5034739.1 alpha-amylase family protein [Conexibacter stalactiti]
MDDRRLWIDPTQRELPPRPWRKIHLDFQNGAGIRGIGSAFDADEFVATLQRAHVDAIVVFAKDTQGYCYYPSEVSPAHPGLVEPDLLGRQVEACRAAGIKVYAYQSFAWDELLAAGHPEWLVWRRDRTTYLPPLGEPPLFSALCIGHPGLMELLLRRTTELLERYPVDGIWIDETFSMAAECYCHRCLDDMRAAGLDPLDRAAQRRFQHDRCIAFVRAVTEHVRGLRPDAQVDYNTQAVTGLRERAPYLANIDIEALPTGGWGYLYFPVHARYARTFGVPVYGMTGKFFKSWGDPGGLKHPVQLRTELAGIVAQGLRCDIGDQLPHTARLDPVVYATIGAAYEEIERIEPYLDGAVPVTEAAILVDAPPLGQLSKHALAFLEDGEDFLPTELGPSVSGMAKLLIERQLQFDVVDGPADLDRYGLVVVPDGIDVDAALAARLEAYLAGGGTVIAAQRSLRVPGEQELWPRALRGLYAGPSPCAPPFAWAAAEKPALLRISPELLGDASAYADHGFALYDGADRWRLPSGADAVVHARMEEPRLDREPGTADDDEPYAAVVQAGGLAAFAFPLGASYHDHGYWIYRELFARVVERLLPRPLVRTSAPQSAEVTVTHQLATSEHGERWIVHVVNYSPLRRSLALEFVEDPIPLRDVRVALAIDAPIARVTEARTGVALACERRDDRWQVTVDAVPVAATIVFEAAR